MFGKNYYFGLTRKYVTVFGTLFNDISIDVPYTDNGSKVKTIKVPLTYGSQDKLLARTNTDPDLTRKVAAVSPAMSFLVSSPRFDPERMGQSTLERRLIDQQGQASSQFIGVPYNLDFQLFIYSDKEEDGLRILENIIPYFTPSLSVTVKLVPEMNYELDIPLTLNDVIVDNKSWGNMDERRSVLWTLNFTMKVQYTGPINAGRKLIKYVINDFYTIDPEANNIANIVTVQPGLTSNGQPTSSLDDTIPYTQINVDDDFGYITTIHGDHL